MKVLLVEDEQVLARVVSEYLNEEGFLCETASDFDQGFEKVSLYQYDCVLLDVTLPGGSGIDILKQLKKTNPDSGVIIISARNSLDDKLVGLDTGADDYLTKPFHLPELNSRIRSVIRRRSFSGKNEFTAGSLRILPDQLQVFAGNNEIRLTRKEFDLLMFFVMNRNRMLSREAIAEHLWGDEADMADNFDFLYSHIKNLRKKIAEAGGSDPISTVYGIGYKFVDS